MPSSLYPGRYDPANQLFIHCTFNNACIIFRTRLLAKLHLQVGLQVKPAVFGIRNDCKTGWSVSLFPPPSRFAQREKTSSQKTHTSTGLCLRSSRGSGLLLPFCLSLLNQVRLAFVFTVGFRMSSMGVERRLVVDTIDETGYESRITENLYLRKKKGNSWLAMDWSSTTTIHTLPPPPGCWRTEEGEHSR